MKIQKIKNFGKKFFASIVLAIFTMGIFTPLAQAQQRWHISSLDKTFFEIPQDDRNLEDFVFSNQQFQYKNWSKDEDKWISQEAKITANMVWYNHYFSPYANSNGMQKITNQELSTFFVVVNNHYYNPEGKFAFPILRDEQIKYMYVYWKKDENENFCLYMDFQNEGQEVFKIENTCHRELYARKPFLLFFQIERTGFDVPDPQKNIGSNFKYDGGFAPRYKVSVTTTYNATYQDKPYITFYKPETFHLNEENFLHGTTSMIEGGFSLDIQKDGGFISLLNSVFSINFLRQGNQRAFRPYSFFFEDDYNAQALKLAENSIGDMSQYDNICWNYSYHYQCQISFPIEPISWFESFVLSVAAQYYNSPAVTNDNTYIEVPDPIKGEGFEPMKYENCSNYDIGCHARNIGRSFYNFINESVLGKTSDDGSNNSNNDANLLFKYADYKKCSFFDVFCHIQNLGLAIYNGIGMVLNGIVGLVKNIFSGAFNSFLETEFYKTWIQPIYDYFSSFVKVIFNLFTGKYDFDTLKWGNQEYFCSKNPQYFIIENTTNQGDKPIETLGSIWYLLNPIPPKEGTQICTSLGLKTIKYGPSTIIDLILFNIFVFAGIWFMFLFLRKYN